LGTGNHPAWSPCAGVNGVASGNTGSLTRAGLSQTGGRKRAEQLVQDNNPARAGIGQVPAWVGRGSASASVLLVQD